VELDLSGFIRDYVSGTGTAKVIAVVDTPGDARAVSVASDRVLVADGPAGLQVVEPGGTAEHPAPVVVGTYPTADMCRGVAGSGTIAYLAVGDRGLEIVDVSDPAAPKRLGGLVVRRPINRVTIGPAGILFLANDAAGMMIVDASDPGAVRQIYPRPQE